MSNTFFHGGEATGGNSGTVTVTPPILCV